MDTCITAGILIWLFFVIWAYSVSEEKRNQRRTFDYWQQCHIFWKQNFINIHSYDVVDLINILPGLLSWCRIFKSSHCNSFEDWAHINYMFDGVWSPNSLQWLDWMTGYQDRSPLLDTKLHDPATASAPKGQQLFSSNKQLEKTKYNGEFIVFPSRCCSEGCIIS